MWMGMWLVGVLVACGKVGFGVRGGLLAYRCARHRPPFARRTKGSSFIRL